MPPTIYLDSLGSIGSPGGQTRSGGPQFSLADVESNADWRSGLNKRYRDEIADINAVPDQYDVARKAERDAFQHEQAMPADPNRLAQFSPSLRGVDSLSNADLGKLEVGQFQADEQSRRLQDLERIKQQDDLLKLQQLEDYRISKLKQDAALSAANNTSREKVATIREGGETGGSMAALFGEAPTNNGQPAQTAPPVHQRSWLDKLRGVNLPQTPPPVTPGIDDTMRSLGLSPQAQQQSPIPPEAEALLPPGTRRSPRGLPVDKSGIEYQFVNGQWTPVGA